MTKSCCLKNVQKFGTLQFTVQNISTKKNKLRFKKIDFLKKGSTWISYIWCHSFNYPTKDVWIDRTRLPRHKTWNCSRCTLTVLPTVKEKSQIRPSHLRLKNIAKKLVLKLVTFDFRSKNTPVYFNIILIGFSQQGSTGISKLIFGVISSITKDTWNDRTRMPRHQILNCKYWLNIHQTLTKCRIN